MTPGKESMSDDLKELRDWHTTAIESGEWAGTHFEGRFREILSLIERCEMAEAAIATPEVWAGVVSEAAEKHWAGLIVDAQRERDELRAVVAVVDGMLPGKHERHLGDRLAGLLADLDAALARESALREALKDAWMEIDQEVHMTCERAHEVEALLSNRARAAEARDARLRAEARYQAILEAEAACLSRAESHYANRRSESGWLDRQLEAGKCGAAVRALAEREEGDA